MTGKNIRKNPMRGSPIEHELNLIPVKPDTFLKGGIRFSDILRWSFALTFAKLQELLANPYQSMEQKAFPFNVMILTFEKTLTPIVDEEFREEIRKINQAFYDKYDGPAFWLDASYGLKHLEAIMRLLNRVGVLRDESLIIDAEATLDELVAELTT